VIFQVPASQCLENIAQEVAFNAQGKFWSLEITFGGLLLTKAGEPQVSSPQTLDAEQASATWSSAHSGVVGVTSDGLVKAQVNLFGT
jgi:uncharacterized membrane protein